MLKLSLLPTETRGSQGFNLEHKLIKKRNDFENTYISQEKSKYTLKLSLPHPPPHQNDFPWSPCKHGHVSGEFPVYIVTMSENMSTNNIYPYLQTLTMKVVKCGFTV